MDVSLCDIVKLYLTEAGRILGGCSICGSKVVKADGLFCIALVMDYVSLSTTPYSGT